MLLIKLYDLLILNYFLLFYRQYYYIKVIGIDLLFNLFIIQLNKG